MMNTHALPRRAAAVAAALAVLALSSCGDNRVPRYPIRGKALVDGKPVPGVIVMLYAVKPVPGFDVNPYAETDAEGNFSFSSYDQADGAPSGEYVMTFDWPVMGGPFKNRPDGPDRLGGRYAKDKSQFKVTVETQAKELETFQLKSDPKVAEQIKRRGNRPSLGGD
ncbi:MAG TPA: hypothetical protein VFG68_14570 [Fimbriiglobus sp.]|nr:hypothetical protein [Fimbriiglobus sp.]